MRIRLYIVHGSHPCAAVMKALDLKGLEYSVFEWPPPLHAPMQRVLFGRRTVPSMSLDGEKISGSRAIMRRLDEIAPEPPLLPRDLEERARVEEAERWGDEVFQPIARTLIWPALKNSPDAIVSYSVHSRLPMPDAALRASAPVVTRLAMRLNDTDDATASRALADLAAHFDRVDGYIADGVIGDADSPNAADLQIASTVRLMLTLGDVQPLLAGRPCAELALALWPEIDGAAPAGSIITRT